MLQTPPASPKPVSDMIQKKIDHIVATSPAQPKRPKVYCDKWVHEGVCAFTQQGCKYKHEMPMDKATQNSLGLFHGLPAWWKKHQAELQRQQDSEETVTITGVDYGIASSANNASAGTMVGGFQMLGIGAGNVPVNGVGGRDRALTSPATTIPQSTLSQPPGQGWRPNDGTFKHTSMPYRSSPGTVPPGNAGQAQMATFRSNVATVPRLSDPRLPLRHRESLPPLPPSCMWGPIGPPSKFPGLSHGDTAADAGPGTARWGLNRTGPAMMPHGPQPPPGFVGFSGAEGNDVSTQGPTGLAVLNPRSGK
ncbi:hypothetical protein SODALDRAFT_203339 [Sodiomyces alkalinus F11]|uniref:C3H1-type domain-containing protein n=1 Tax=Sodiomyces alkalinus (strain CBS 110278 / VKM F-3762 / F11) TaxID=1314773 RepID=A0A3N2PT82_SODAK|nr:hypothetical protein SODALDRAFT_203339 [Sodiomyces alkalinus F11]ROT37698.1 hypothetical protein SODALDRAFT_203339 [Sodiomyces alkalinus F11]